jgi:hypothetical protein
VGLFSCAQPAKASCAARNNNSTSAAPWAAPTKAASNWLGGSQTPASIIPRWNLPNRAVSDFAALVKSVTGLSVKNHVNIDPTRFVTIGTSSSRAIAATHCAIADVVSSSPA